MIVNLHICLDKESSNFVDSIYVLIRMDDYNSEASLKDFLSIHSALGQQDPLFFC